jgi:hypothetical protein
MGRWGGVIFAINYSRTEAEVAMPDGESIIGECAGGVTRLPAYGVCVVRESRPAPRRRA